MTETENIKKTDVIIREPKINYAENFGFLTDYLDFSSDGIPQDKETASFFQRRVNHSHTPAQIAISVLVYALNQCYSSIVDYIFWKDAQQDDVTFDYVREFWTEEENQAGSVLRPYQSLAETNLFNCYIIDWRGMNGLPAARQVESWQALSSHFGVVVILSDTNPKISAFCTQPAPFGVASFLTRQEWDKFCENLM